MLRLSLLVVLCAMAAHAKLVLTPQGFMPDHCVHFAPEGSHIEDHPTHGFKLTRPTGEVILGDPACRITHKANDLPNGWTAYTSWKSPIPQDVTEFIGTWNVPPKPVNAQDGQTLFTFTGLQNAYMSQPPEGVFIIQPVLQWGPSAAGGGSYWTIASWYVGSGAVYSNLVTVSSGDSIFGNMTNVGKSLSDNKWFITAQSKNTGKSSSITVTTLAREPWAFVTLEVYSISQCTDFPTGKISYNGLSLWHAKSRLAPVWQTNSQGMCNEKVQVVSPTSVNLVW